MTNKDFWRQLASLLATQRIKSSFANYFKSKAGIIL